MLGLVKYCRYDVNKAWNFLKKLSTFYRSFFQKHFDNPKFDIWSIFTSTKYNFWGAARNLQTKFYHGKINFSQFYNTSRVITGSSFSTIPYLEVKISGNKGMLLHLCKYVHGAKRKWLIWSTENSAENLLK